MSPRIRLPIWFKLVLGAALLTIGVASMVGWLAYAQARDRLHNRIRWAQHAVAAQLGQELGHVLGQAQRELTAVATVLAAPELSEAARLVLVRGLVLAAGPADGLDHVAIYDSRGAYIDRLTTLPSLPAAASTLALPLPPSGLGVPVAWEEGGRLPLAVPIVVDGAPTGYVHTLIPLASVQALLERLAHERLAHAVVRIVDLDARVVVSTEAAELATPTSLRAHPMFAVASQGALHNGVALLRDDYLRDGERMVGTFAPMFGWPMLISVEQPRHHAYAELRELGWQVALATCAVIVLASLAAFGLGRRLVAPIPRLLAQTRALAARDFAARVHVATADEFALLGEAYNQAAAELSASEAQLREEAAIRTDLGRYLPAPVVEAIVRREQAMELGGRRRFVAVLFADVVAFTPLTLKHEPEVVVTMLNELFTILAEIIFKHEGMLDKFIGDAVMATWGIRESETPPVALAMAAAVDMQRWLEFGRARWQERYGVALEIAIGIHAGEAVVGNIGSTQRMEFTAIGYPINLAARVESVARPQQILITQAAFATLAPELRATWDVREVPARALPGTQGEVALLEVMGL